jgi:hypothetical protein
VTLVSAAVACGGVLDLEWHASCAHTHDGDLEEGETHVAAVLKLVDQTTRGEILREATLTLASTRVSAREIIERRVRMEVQTFNEQQDQQVFQGLVQPTDTERELNGYRLRKPRKIDADEQIRRAIDAFESNRFFMLVGDRQVESLDELIGIARDTRVSFLKLVPLVGG